MKKCEVHVLVLFLLMTFFIDNIASVNASHWEPDPQKWVWVYSNDKAGVFLSKDETTLNKTEKVFEHNILKLWAEGEYEYSMAQVMVKDDAFYLREHNLYHYDNDGHYKYHISYTDWLIAPPGTVINHMCCLIVEQYPKEK